MFIGKQRGSEAPVFKGIERNVHIFMKRSSFDRLCVKPIDCLIIHSEMMRIGRRSDL